MTHQNGINAQTDVAGSCGFQVSLACCAWFVYRHNLLGDGWLYGSLIFLSAVVLDLVLYRSGRWFNNALLWIPSLGLMALADHQLTYLEARGWGFSDWFGLLTHVGLGTVGLQTSFESGLVGLNSHEGMVRFIASPEKTGVRWALMLLLIWGVFYMIRSPKPRLSSVLLVTLGAVSLLILRQVMVYTLFIENDRVLEAGNGFSTMAYLSFGLIPNISLLLFGGILISRFEYSRATYARVLEDVTVLNRRKMHQTLAALILSLGFVGGFFQYVLPAGPQKLGRVLIDDKLSGQWEPTARLLDTEWYGDFSTYSFSSLTEWLGCHFLVDVNTTIDYTPELLQQYDVLLIKTPEKDLLPFEVQAIRNWVQGGGGLLLVGDHTNLMGTSTRLNQLTEGWGIELNFDAVSSGSGGFNYVERDYAAVHPGLLAAKSILFMTSCSIAADIWSDLVIVDSDAARSSHDYAGRSFFSDTRYFPEQPYGPAVLCATKDVGRGRVAVFSDSTIWSSFAIFQFGRSELLLGLVNYLNYESSGSKTFTRVTGAISLLFVALTVVYVRSTNAFLIAIVSILAGVLSGDVMNEFVYQRPKTQREIREVVFVHKGGMCAFPQTLGGTGDLEAGLAFDTFFVATQRLGLVPRVAYEFDEILGPSTKAVVFISPVVPPSVDHIAKLRQFLRHGGEVIIIDSLEPRRMANGIALARSLQYDLSLSRGEFGETSIGLPGGSEQMVFSDKIVGGRYAIGAGHITYLSGASQFSREVLGHCFTVPRKESRMIYEAIYKIFTPIEIELNERRTYGLR